MTRHFSTLAGGGLAAGAIALLLAQPLATDRADSYGTHRVTPVANAEDAADVAEAVGDPLELLDTYCASCHGPDEQKGSVRFDQLDTTDPVQLQQLYTEAKEVLEWEDMPPSKAKQPTAAQRATMIRWLDSKISPEEKKKLADKLRKPQYGNYVDHDALFSGENAHLPGYTTDRRWLISEFIFDAKMQRILNGRTVGEWQNKRVEIFGGHEIRGLGLANPFLLPETSGVRYYALEGLTRGHLSTMLGNANKAAQYLTGEVVTRNKKIVPAINEIMAMDNRHAATLAEREELLSNFIAKLCEDMYGSGNASLLPAFVPVVLQEGEGLDTDESGKSKLLPPQVAFNYMSKAGGLEVFIDVVMDPANADKTPQEIADICERIWFYNGDHERDIQGRLALIRDYCEAFIKQIEGNQRKYKPRVYKPLDDAEMQVIRETIRKHRRAGDRYDQLIDKCMDDWDRQFTEQRIAAGPPTDEALGELVDQLFSLILERSPSDQERADYVSLANGYVEKLGKLTAIQKLIQTLMLTSEFAYRSEFGVGEPDEHGRRMLPPRDAAYAIAYALTDQSPDEQLLEAAATGRLDTREDYKREVERLLAERDVYYRIDKTLADRWREGNVTNMPIRELRFWREFFGYPKALKIFKDEKRFGGDRLSSATNRLVEEADRMVAHILEEDQDVIEKLLTTEEFIVYHDGDNERMQARSDEIKRIYEYFKDKNWQDFKMEDLTKTNADFLRTVNMRTIDPDKPNGRTRQGNMLQLFKKSMDSITKRMADGQEHPAPFDLYRGYGNDFLPGYNVGKFWNHDLDNWHYEPVQPAKVPNRKGMLTHPAWLIAHAFNTETDPVHRGKWVREKLLAGTIPDVPITVDAQIPEDHNKTLRQRLAMATENQYCWRCHVDMNPLGNAFEMYDDFGRFRTIESLEYEDKLIEEGPEQKGDHLIDTRNTYQTLPVDSSGYLEGTGDSSLDGEITGAIDLAERLGQSQRVRQSIIRHAFRYYMGRNETLNDSKTLIDAEEAYVQSGGSFDAVIVSLLTSDSFIYRKAIED
jgi:mono/diheme cytochrome c family protein